MKTVTLEFLLRVFRLGGFDSHPDIWWRTDGEYAPVTLLVNVNDVFCYASADCEEITPENIEVWEKAHNDLDALFPDTKRPDGGRGDHAWDAWWAHTEKRIECTVRVDALFVARVRKERPLMAYIKKLPEKAQRLFLDAGPPKTVQDENWVKVSVDPDRLAT